MDNILNISENQFIAYKIHQTKKIFPTIVFLHGLMSSMESSKATFLHQWCEEYDLPFIRFDNFGSGSSSGLFSDQTISTWLDGAESVIKNLCPNGVILVGSSMGGWVSLLAAMRNPELVKGLVGIAPAPDFTEDMWNSLSDNDQKLMVSNGSITFTAGPYSYNISNNLIKNGKTHLLLQQDRLPISCKVRLIHGMEDKEVSYHKSLKLISKISSDDALCTLVKTGTHSLSRPEDLNLIAQNLISVIESL